MRIAKVLILIALLSTLSHAQDLSIEKDFEREKGRLSVVRYVLGEDATSGFYYFVYKSRSRVKKIRMVWNGGATNDPYAQDFYFKDGSPVLYVELSGERKRLAAVIRGRNTSLRQVEKLYLKDSKVTMWVENGKMIPSSDARWKEKEGRVLEQFKEQLETYREYREGKL
ncbi:MAG: hypothetical protein ACXWIF_14425 [Pyrinomonadaceae bacterium]